MTAPIMRSLPTSIGTAASPVPGMSSASEPRPAPVKAALPCSTLYSLNSSRPPMLTTTGARATPCGNRRYPTICLPSNGIRTVSNSRIEQLAIFAKCFDRFLVIGAFARRVLRRPGAKMEIEPRLVPVLFYARHIGCRARCRSVTLAHGCPGGGPFLRVNAGETGQYLAHITRVDAHDGIGLMIGASLHVGAQFGERLGGRQRIPLREGNSCKRRANERHERNAAADKQFLHVHSPL